MSNNDEIQFCRRLAYTFRDIGKLLSEHVAYYEELLPHVFIADVTRYVLADGPGRASVVQFLEDAFCGSAGVEDLIAMSFVENIESSEELSRALAGVTGHQLKSEWERQHSD